MQRSMLISDYTKPIFCHAVRVFPEPVADNSASERLWLTKQLWNEGQTAQQIADAQGVTPEAIWIRIKKLRAAGEHVLTGAEKRLLKR